MAGPAGTIVHHRACNLCEAMCGLRIEAEAGRVTKIRGDEEDPFSRGYLCPKAFALKDLHEDPDRLRRPMRRTKGGFEPIAWDDALDEAAAALARVQREHGDDAVAVYLGNPVVHNTGGMMFGPMFVHALHTKNRYSATSVDQLPHMLVAYWMFGHQILLPVPDIDRTQHFLVFGANPLASNGSLMTAPGMRRRIDALRARGGRLVVVDPRRTETAERADMHVFVKPGADAWLLLGMLHVLLARGAKLGRLASFTDRLDVLEHVARTTTPERVAPRVGVSPDVVRRLADDFAEAPSAVCYGRVGTSTQAFGTLCQWLINAINIVTGNFDRAGGAMFTKPAIDPIALKQLGAGSYGRWKSRVRGFPEANGELPVAVLGEEIDTSGKGRIRALVTIAGNPVLSTPNGARLDRVLPSLDFMVSIDPYLNETTRHAHLVLPTPSSLERLHYDLAFHVLAVRDTARFAPALFEPEPDARHDWQILLGLARRIETLRKRPGRAATLRALERIGPERLIDVALRIGRYGTFRRGLSLEKLRASPHGIDLGPLTPSLPGRLPKKRIDLAPEPLVRDLERLFATEAEASPRMVLIGRRHLRDNNSWMHNVAGLMTGKARCTLFVHPDDAREIGIGDGDRARVRSRVGEVCVPVTITDEVMPGVVSLPHGYGHHRRGVRLSVASDHAGVSMNDLTDDTFLDALSGNAALSGVPVDVTPA
jgi:anaerobic selenocysteine-containing dehydrogenase